MKNSLDKDTMVIRTTKAKFFLHIFFIASLLISLFLFFDFRIRYQFRQVVADNFISVLKVLSTRHEQYIYDGQQLVKILSRSPVIIDKDVLSCNSYLATLKQDYPTYAQINLLDANGQLICGTGYSSSQILSVGAFREYFNEAVHKKKLTMSEYSIGILSRKPVLIIAQPILDVDQNVSSVIMLSLDLNWINQDITEFHLPADRSLLILDKNGVVLGGFWSEEKMIGHSIAKTKIFKSLISSNGEGALESNEIDGVDKIFTFSKLRGTLEEHQIYVVIGIPKTSIDEIVRVFSYAHYMTWLIFVFALFVIMYVIDRYLTNSKQEKSKKRKK